MKKYEKNILFSLLFFIIKRVFHKVVYYAIAKDRSIFHITFFEVKLLPVTILYSVWWVIESIHSFFHIDWLVMFDLLILLVLIEVRLKESTNFYILSFLFSLIFHMNIQGVVHIVIGVVY